jgi:ABC-type phosphate transport system substrate-binding protein
MKNNRGRTMKKLLSIFLFVPLILLLGARAQAQVLVIANPGVPAADISRAELHDIFTGASSSLKGGAPVTPVLLKPGPVHDEFLSLYIGKSDTGFRAGWRSILFSGQGILPKTLGSDTAVVEYVIHTPGAIGYIASITPHPGVKILVVR